MLISVLVFIALVLVGWLIYSSLIRQKRARALLVELLKYNPDLPDLMARYKAISEDAQDVLKKISQENIHSLVLLELMKEAYLETQKTQQWS